jgi:hypothetical protein
LDKHQIIKKIIQIKVQIALKLELMGELLLALESKKSNEPDTRIYKDNPPITDL